MPQRTDAPCGESLDIIRAHELRALFTRALDAERPVTMQAGGVERVDAMGIQLLAAFLRAARERGIAVDWLNPSQPLQRAVRLLGLARELDLPTSGKPLDS